MSVLTNFPAMPNRIAIACEYLAYLEPDGAPEESIEAQLSPLKKGESDEESSGKTMAEDVLGEMDRLGLLVRKGEKNIALAEELRVLATAKVNWLQALRPLLRQRIVFPEFADQYRQNELPEAIAWLLVQDPFRPLPWKGGEHVLRITAQLGEGDILRGAIANDSRYQNLLYWARYLGFVEWLGTKGGNAVIPDPTSVLEDCLDSVFRGLDELPILSFVQRLGEQCPVFEEGVVRRNVEARLAADYMRKDRHLSRSTSLALKRLSLRGRIKLVSTSDAASWVLDLGKETQAVSHVHWLNRGRA